MLDPKFDYETLLRRAPNGPGVYQFVSGKGEVLYVGKAKSLKKRLSSYFRKSGMPPKTNAMMSHVQDVELTLTHTESEALLLESNLIKKHRPRYNIVLRDDKSYPYIRLDDSHAFPRLSFYRGSRREPGQYFGPYASAHSVRQTLSQLQKIFPVRQCEDTFYRLRSRPCLQYQIERCSAPCVGLVGEDVYAEDVKQAILFLEGRDTTLADYLADKMEEKSGEQDYEMAARYRDRIKAIRRVIEHQYISGGDGDSDVIVLCADNEHFCIDVTFIRGGRNSGSKSFFPKPSLDEDTSQVLAAFIGQFYINKVIPEEIVVYPQPENKTLLESALMRHAKKKVKIIVRPRGRRARVVEQALSNAEARLSVHIANRHNQIERIEALRQYLDLDEVPNRIECFDASHISGESTVVSCVVFDINGPRKSDYRRFNIEHGRADDYAALTEALHRRFKKIKKGEGEFPDLLLIDGGKGQVNAAKAVLDELQVEGIVILGVAKGLGRKPGRERFFFPGRRQPLLAASDSPALHYIQFIRDEAHRFAITGHRQRRSKKTRRSKLHEIPGIGNVKRQALLKHLGGLQEVARAGVDDLADVPGISRQLAQRIYSFFHE
ncbi:MAG: excinuclease ABC subunit UvrC [Arenicellales bacterium]|nr:excinuclease ABC subunit UvrC [Arenicellales bacterium]